MLEEKIQEKTLEENLKNILAIPLLGRDKKKL
jgi:hypothetical protein